MPEKARASAKIPRARTSARRRRGKDRPHSASQVSASWFAERVISFALARADAGASCRRGRLLPTAPKEGGREGKGKKEGAWEKGGGRKGGREREWRGRREGKGKKEGREAWGKGGGRGEGKKKERREGERDQSEGDRKKKMEDGKGIWREKEKVKESEGGKEGN